MSRLWFIPLITMVCFVGLLLLLNKCGHNSRNQNVSKGMLEQCQRDFDLLLESCYGSKNESD
jgi:hypothetical protein